MNLGPIHYHDTETAQTVALGTRYRQDSSGRTWYYSENGAVQADPGKLMVEAATVANHINLSFETAPAVGDKTIKVTLGATAVSADDYRDGRANIQDGTGEGINLFLGEHEAFDSAGTATFQLLYGERVTVAGALSESNVNLERNHYKEVLISSTDQADPQVGVYNVTVAAAAFGMIQTWGPAAVWQDEAIAIGSMVTTGTGVAGQVEAADGAGEPLLGQQGPNTGVIAEYQTVYLRLEP